jgi:hypothetical protein
MQARYQSQDLELAKRLTENAEGTVPETKAGRHSEAMVLGIIQSLKRIVRKLATPESRTTWGNYETDHSYAEGSFAAKKAFVERAVQSRRRSLAWDIGCNTGTFSAVAASNSAYVVAIDGDARAVERLYQRQKQIGAENILPLVMNLSSASPDQGWRGKERKALEKRGRPELILCLALIHHIVISANIPLAEFLDWLRDFDCDVVIEHVGLQDNMTLMLLRNRINQFQELENANFERLLGERFEIKAREPLKGGTREIFYVSPK